MTDIATVDDIEDSLGVTFDSADEALCDRLRLSVEALARKYVRWAITEQEYTSLLSERGSTYGVLPLPVPFVTEVANVWEDWNSVGGQNSGVFSSATLLTVGEDYWVDYESVSQFSREGVLRRNGARWCPYPRSIKVEYTAGLTANQLNDEFADIKDAIIYETAERFKLAKSKQGTATGGGGSTASSGPITSEKLKNYAVTFANQQAAYSGSSSGSSGRIPSSGLLPETELRLQSIVNYYDYL